MKFVKLKLFEMWGLKILKVDKLTIKLKLMTVCTQQYNLLPKHFNFERKKLKKNGHFEEIKYGI